MPSEKDERKKGFYPQSGKSQNVPVDPRLIPPHSLEAERSVLGALLLDGNAFHKVQDVGLESADFYRDAHAKIFEAIHELVARSEPADLITLTTALKNKNCYEEVGGSAYLTGLFDSAYSSANVGYYSKIVKEKAIIRRLISATNELAGKAYDGIENLEEFLDEAEKTIFEVTDTQIRSDFVSIKQVLLDNMETFQELQEKKGDVSGLPTGFTSFDHKTAGLHPGALIIIAARPAMGKTSLVLNIASNSALSSDASVALFSLEMSKEELGVRLLSSVAQVDASRLKVGKLSDRDWKALAKAAGNLSKTNIYIDDTPAISVMEMRSRCRRLMSDKKLDLIIVDYLQLMRGNNRAGRGMDSREREISEISRNLKALAKELSVPVIALSQLNRGVESRPDKRPMLSDLRESGAIEQDADIVCFVYRDEVYNKESEDKGVAELILAKHRAGSVGTVRLAWQAEFTAFGNLANDYYDQPQNPGQQQPPPGFNDDDPFGDGGPPPKKGGLDLPNF